MSKKHNCCKCCKCKKRPKKIYHDKNIQANIQSNIEQYVEQNIVEIFKPTNFEPKKSLNNKLIVPLDLPKIRNAYGINNIPLSNGKQLGNGIKIAIIVAGLYPNAQKDLDFFCNFHKLPRTKLNLVNLGARSALRGWDIEACLDIQCAYTMALGSSIYLIQARSASYNDIMSAINWCNVNNMDIINMSLGSFEFLQQNTYKRFFTKTNVLYCAASGDDSAIPCFPSSLSNVLSIGGTTLVCDANNNRLNETTWSSAGCKPSKYEPKPNYQNGIDDLPATLKFRNTPDISANASPDSGVKIYFNGSWRSVGGTSASCPIVCGILAIVSEKRKLLKKPPLNTIMNHPNDIHKILYDLTKTNNYTKYFYDVTQGTNSIYKANSNYDIPTGCGVLKADEICKYLQNL